MATDKIDAERYRWIEQYKPAIRHDGKASRWYVTVWPHPTSGAIFTGIDIDLATAIDKAEQMMRAPVSARRRKA